MSWNEIWHNDFTSTGLSVQQPYGGVIANVGGLETLYSASPGATKYPSEYETGLLTDLEGAYYVDLLIDSLSDMTTGWLWAILYGPRALPDGITFNWSLWDHVRLQMLHNSVHGQQAYQFTYSYWLNGINVDAFNNGFVGPTAPYYIRMAWNWNDISVTVGGITLACGQACILWSDDGIAWTPQTPIWNIGFIPSAFGFGGLGVFSIKDKFDSIVLYKYSFPPTPPPPSSNWTTRYYNSFSALSPLPGYSFRICLIY